MPTITNNPIQQQRSGSTSSTSSASSTDSTSSASSTGSQSSFNSISPDVTGEQVSLDRTTASSVSQTNSAITKEASGWKTYTPPQDKLLSRSEVAMVKRDMLETTIGMIPQLIRDNPQAAGRLTTHEQGLRAEIAAMEHALSDPTPINNSVAMEAITPKSLPATLYGNLEKTAGVPEGSLREQWKDQYIRNASEGIPWAPMERRLELSGANMTSRTTPINSSYGAQYGPEGKDYGDTGLSSMTPRLDPAGRKHEKENQRVTNFWLTELVDSDSGEQVFRSLRSGAIAGKFLGSHKDAPKKDVAFDNAMELFETAIIQDVRERPTLGDFERTIDLVSIDLMSSVNEKGKITKQETAMQAAAEHINEHGVKVRLENPNGTTEDVIMHPTVRCHNFRAAVNNLGEFVVSQGSSNKEAFRSFSQAYDEHKTDGRDYTLDDALLSDVKSHLGKTHSYEFPAKLATLASRNGCQVHFNCKSGKDRTGMMDAESKLYASQMHQASKAGSSELPSYELKKDDPRREDLLKLIFEGGNMDITRLNTKVKGLKIAPVKMADRALIGRLGGTEVLHWVQGGKRYTGIDGM